MIQINQPTRRNSFTSLLIDVYVWLNMFRAPFRPSSGAYNCTRSLWFYRWSVAVGALLVVVWQLDRFIWIVWWCTDLRTSNLKWCSRNLKIHAFCVTNPCKLEELAPFIFLWKTGTYIPVFLFIQLRTAALRFIVLSWLDVPTFATRRLHACHHARAPSGGRWNCGREVSGNFA